MRKKRLFQYHRNFQYLFLLVFSPAGHDDMEDRTKQGNSAHELHLVPMRKLIRTRLSGIIQTHLNYELFF